MSPALWGLCFWSHVFKTLIAAAQGRRPAKFCLEFLGVEGHGAVRRRDTIGNQPECEIGFASDLAAAFQTIRQKDL